MNREQTRQLKNEYQKRYYRANREKLMAYAASYRRDHPERILTSVRACHQRISELRAEIRRLERQAAEARKDKTAVAKKRWRTRSVS